MTDDLRDFPSLPNFEKNSLSIPRDQSASLLVTFQLWQSWQPTNQSLRTLRRERFGPSAMQWDVFSGEPALAKLEAPPKVDACEFADCSEGSTTQFQLLASQHSLPSSLAIDNDAWQFDSCRET